MHDWASLQMGGSWQQRFVYHSQAPLSVSTEEEQGAWNEQPTTTTMPCHSTAGSLAWMVEWARKPSHSLLLSRTDMWVKLCPALPHGVCVDHRDVACKSETEWVLPSLNILNFKGKVGSCCKWACMWKLLYHYLREGRWIYCRLQFQRGTGHIQFSSCLGLKTFIFLSFLSCAGVLHCGRGQKGKGKGKRECEGLSPSDGIHWDHCCTWMPSSNNSKQRGRRPVRGSRANEVRIGCADLHKPQESHFSPGLHTTLVKRNYLVELFPHAAFPSWL